MKITTPTSTATPIPTLPAKTSRTNGIIRFLLLLLLLHLHHNHSSPFVLFPIFVFSDASFSFLTHYLRFYPSSLFSSIPLFFLQILPNRTLAPPYLLLELPLIRFSSVCFPGRLDSQGLEIVRFSFFVMWGLQF